MHGVAAAAANAHWDKAPGFYELLTDEPGKESWPITGATFILIYLNGGNDAIVSYAKNLLWFVPPWTVYVVSMIVGVPRFGFWPAMAGSLMLYMSCVGLVRLILR